MASILRVDQLQNKNGEAVMSLSGNTIEFAGGFTPSSVVVPTWTESTRPTTGLNIGYMGLNTETQFLEVYGGLNPTTGLPMWTSMGGSVSGLPFNLYDTDEFNDYISYIQSNKAGYAAAGTNYQYETDAGSNTDRINDAQSDMYDGGNFTQLRVNGAASSNIFYSTTTATELSGVKYAACGYNWPLIAIATSEKNTSTRYGWSRSGNLGADGGGGTPQAYTVYDNETVEGFNPVFAWMVNKSWNQSSDPAVTHVYCTFGHPNWNSSVSNGFNVTTFASSSDSDTSQYESTSTNCVVWTVLLSNGQTQGQMSVAQCQTFISNFLADTRTYFGL